ncbi:hypothetical protein G7Y41_00050 [Schaalia sp. ZJ405]|uniref:hypothetical protein n=1 Tax=Schaalia sp. ZJ405 TaxID=2709403 RepID=UPI0013EE362A|nr:hypothetical protein [Schaalia sp. ZJ405]QPK81326.1 hypothetical protein G7Y41_00050 [Schaalia sp. ZJ405]
MSGNDDDEDDVRTLDYAITLETATRLESCGLKLRFPEALKALDIHDPESVLWAKNADMKPAFSHFVALDYECIYTEQDYPDFIYEIAEAVEVADQLSDVSSRFDATGVNITVRYTFRGMPRELTFAQGTDWIPADVALAIIKDLATLPDRVCLAEVDGQGPTIAWVYPDRVDEFLQLEPDFAPWPPEHKC